MPDVNQRPDLSAYQPAAGPSDADLARFLCLSHWSIDPVLTPLGAERDLIYQVRAEDGQRYVLKVLDPGFECDEIDLQVSAMRHACTSVSCVGLPEPIRAVSGAYYVEAKWRQQEQRLAYLTKWQDGALLKSVPFTAIQAGNFGRALAELSLGLSDFSHPHADRHMRWDLKQAGSVRAHLEAIPGTQDRARVEAALERFDNETLSLLSAQRTQVIHADATPFNTLVSENDHDEITAFIDFGDVVRSAVVCDVAIAACYLMGSGENALALPTRLVQAFHDVRPLSLYELSLIVPLMEARHAMTAAITCANARDNPHNIEAITKNTPTALHGLDVLATKTHSDWTAQLLRLMKD